MENGLLKYKDRLVVADDGAQRAARGAHEGEPRTIVRDLAAVQPEDVLAVSEDRLEGLVGEELTQIAGRRVLLKGDQKLAVGDVRKVMDHIKRAGAPGIELAIEEIKQ